MPTDLMQFGSLAEIMCAAERLVIIQVLQETPSRRAAAKRLGISVRSLFYKIRYHRLTGYPFVREEQPA